MTDKQTIFNQFLTLVRDQVKAYQQTLDELSESAANETRSTAGDKYETALAMLQIEQRNIRMRLSETQDKLKQLESINPLSGSREVITGSLVFTNKGVFFISVALGKIEIDHQMVMSISPQSPLGIKLLGKKVNDIIQVNQASYQIQRIC